METEWRRVPVFLYPRPSLDQREFLSFGFFPLLTTVVRNATMEMFGSLDDPQVNLRGRDPPRVVVT